MNKLMEEKANSVLKLMDEKKEEFKDAKEMKELIDYIDRTRVDVVLRFHADDLDEGWLKAVEGDISRLERSCKGRAGLLPPKDQEAYDNFRKFFLGPCDLPPEVQ